MKYGEYMECAKKHLNGCRLLLSSYKEDGKNDKYVWLELYYLSGYILEGIVIFCAYGNNDWPANEDIKKRYNLVFTAKTGLDYFYKREIKKWAKAEVKEFFANRQQGALSVQGHHFQAIVNELLHNDPSFNGVPYIGDGDIDEEIKKLIEGWKPDVRYRYEEMDKLNGKIIADLINTCNEIYQKTRTK